MHHHIIATIYHETITLHSPRNHNLIFPQLYSHVLKTNNFTLQIVGYNHQQHQPNLTTFTFTNLIWPPLRSLNQPRVTWTHIVFSVCQPMKARSSSRCCRSSSASSSASSSPSSPSSSSPTVAVGRAAAASSPPQTPALTRTMKTSPRQRPRPASRAFPGRAGCTGTRVPGDICRRPPTPASRATTTSLGWDRSTVHSGSIHQSYVAHIYNSVAYGVSIELVVTSLI